MFKYKAKEVQYLVKGFDDVDANFVKIESTYRKCGSTFFSKSQVHKHLKEGCTGLVQTPLTTSSVLVLPIAIIELKSIVPTIRSGPAF